MAFPPPAKRQRLFLDRSVSDPSPHTHNTHSGIVFASSVLKNGVPAPTETCVRSRSAGCGAAFSIRRTSHRFAGTNPGDKLSRFSHELTRTELSCPSLPHASSMYRSVNNSSFPPDRRCCMHKNPSTPASPDRCGSSFKRMSLRSECMRACSRALVRTCSLQRSLNESQRRAVQSPLTTPLLCSAGPGQGKTRVLIARIAYCIAQCVAFVDGVAVAVAVLCRGSCSCSPQGCAA